MTAAFVVGCGGTSADATPALPSGPWFCSDRSGNFEIYRLVDGGAEAVTADAEYDSWWPRPSPDGRTLLFYRSLVADRPTVGGANNNYDAASLWSLDLASGALALRIPKDAGAWLEQGVADWSPNGQHLVMAARASDTGGYWHLYLTDADGGSPVKLTDREGLFLDPSFSPDGTEIVYTALPSDYVPPPGVTAAELLAALEIHRARLVESPPGAFTLVDEQRLTTDALPLRDHDPYWAPDGSEIAFETDMDPTFGAGVGRWALRAVDPDGVATRVVLDDANVNTLPRWSDDSRTLYFHRLVYADLPNRRFRLATVARDGTGLSYLTPGGEYDDSDVQP